MSISVMRFSPGGVRADRGQSASRVLIVAACLITVLAAGVMLGNNIFLYPLSPPKQADPEETYTGVIQMSPDHRDPCERFQFDNKSATLRSTGSAPCGDINATPQNPAAPSGGSIGRMKGIGDYFKNR